MDSVELVNFARALIDIESTTFREGPAGQWLASELERRGYTVTRQPVDATRFNIFAHLDAPDVVLSTHYDCVPPHFPSRVEGEALFGRGACDAKGILAAQLACVERLRRRGERRVGLLFVVGEERGSDGAAIANAAPPGSRYLINGEPTDSRLALATRGVLRVRLNARGRAAHSAAPERGESAIDRLIDALLKLRTLRWPEDPLLGRTFYSIGLIEGGVAPNVISPSASAEVLFRIVGSPEPILTTLESLSDLVAVEEILRVPAMRMHDPGVDGIATDVFPFTTDVPFLSAWGAPLLFGPGSFLVAHTDHEQLALAELHAAVSGYERLSEACLARSA
jgi:acetylornithine deacetylase